MIPSCLVTYTGLTLGDRYGHLYSLRSFVIRFDAVAAPSHAAEVHDSGQTSKATMSLRWKRRSSCILLGSIALRELLQIVRD